MATALVAVTIFTVQPTPQAQASWWCWSWWGCEAPALPSAQSLISERPNLARQPSNVREYLGNIIEKYRNYGAPEEDVKIFIDNLDKQYQHHGSLNIKNFLSHLSAYIITPAYAGPELACPLAPAVCTGIAVAVGKALQKTGEYTLKNYKALTALVAGMASTTIIVTEAKLTGEADVSYPPRPSSGCGCECQVQTKAVNFPLVHRLGWAKAFGPGMGGNVCKKVFDYACEEAKSKLTKTAINYLKRHQRPIPSDISDVHHERGLCIDKRGKKFRMQGRSVQPTN